MSLCVSGAVGKRCSQVNSFTSSIEPRGSQTHTLKWKHHQLSRRQAPWTYSLKVFVLDQKPWALSNIHHFSVQESDWVHGGVNFRGKKAKHTCMKQRTFEFLKVRLSTCILFDIKRLLIVKELVCIRSYKEQLYPRWTDGTFYRRKWDRKGWRSTRDLSVQ